MKNQGYATVSFFRTACLFEGSLLPLAMLFGWLAGVDCFAGLAFSEQALVRGCWLTLPPLLFFFMLQMWPHAELRRIRELLQKTLAVRLHPYSWADLFILAALAGIGEEVLFRGFLQPWLETLWNATAALVVSNLLFGLLHAVTPLYAFLALLIGLYLGLALDYGGERQLLVPIVIHALYDFVVFLVILRQFSRQN